MIRRESLKDQPLSIKDLCLLSGVSRSGYYRWVAAAETRLRREKQDQADFENIKMAYDFRGYAKGYRSIRMRLLRMGIRMNHKKIIRLMKKFGLKCPIRRLNPYRCRGTESCQPEISQLWSQKGPADGHHIHTAEQRFLLPVCDQGCLYHAGVGVSAE